MFSVKTKNDVRTNVWFGCNNELEQPLEGGVKQEQVRHRQSIVIKFQEVQYV